MPMIFFNIGWMKHYQGQNASDKILGEFEYIVTHGTGHEQYNFLPHKGFMYGYAPVKWNKESQNFQQVAIEKLGAEKGDDHISGVTVIFISRNPTTQTTYVVGWYMNATVYRQPQELRLKGRVLNKESLFYVCKAKLEDTHCIPESERFFVVPSAHKEKGGYGQSTIWYAQQRQDIQDNALKYIADGETPYQTPKRTNNGLSQEDKKNIENSAIRAATIFFESHGFQVDSVEADNCGWDLTVYSAVEEFCVEVKGTAGKIVNFQLTPNEYKILKRHWRKYKIAVAINCLGDAHLDVFSIWHDSKADKYFGHNDAGSRLELKEKIDVYAVGCIQ